MSGLTFAAKDLFDVAGFVTGCGNPDWADTHEAAQADAWAVDVLLEAGATLLGKTITDEISLGLLGINKFYGTPQNPRAPDRVPGGSSSGSASAVAGGLVDIALGTDSGGSVRIPASFCGLYGLRPTHGRIPTDGMMTQAPSFDTVGYFARDAATFGRAGSVLLVEQVVDALPAEIIVATDCFALADEPVRRALLPVLDRLRLLAPVGESFLANGDLRNWSHHQRVLQKSEFHATFRDWIDRVNPRFSAEVAGAFADDGCISPGDLAAANAFRADASNWLDELLDGRHVLCMPTSPIVPIGRAARLSDMRTAVRRIVDLTAIAGLTGLPQVNLPVAAIGSIPVGLSLVGWRGGDAALVGAACSLAAISQSDCSGREP
jgi:amidase